MDCQEEFEKMFKSNYPFHKLKATGTHIFAYRVWQACWNLRQESKPLTELQIQEILTKYFYHDQTTENCPVCAASYEIHAAIPSQPDIEQQEWEIAEVSPQEMWDELQDIRRITDDDGTTGSPSNLVKQLKTDIISYESGAREDGAHIDEQDEQIKQLKADIRSYADAANNWASVSEMQTETINGLNQEVSMREGQCDLFETQNDEYKQRIYALQSELNRKNEQIKRLKSGLNEIIDISERVSWHS